jgi:amino acid permease
MPTITVSEGSPLLSGRRSLARGSASTPRSPFETGFPTLFTSPIPSPRPHRLPFAFDNKPQTKHRELHVFLTLTMSTVGAGMLSVPYTFLLVPTWAALLGVLLVGVGMALTANALLLAHVQLAQQEEKQAHIGSGRKFASFQAIAVAAGGHGLGYAVSVITAVGIYGGCVGCVRIVRDVAPFLVVMFHRLVAGANAQPLLSATAHQIGDYVMWAVFGLVVFPLCLMKNLTKLHISSYLGFLFSLYLVAAIIYRSFFALDTSDSDSDSVSVNSTALVADTLSAAVNAAAQAAQEAAQAAAAAKMPTIITGSTLSRFAHAISIYNYAFMMHLNLVPLFIQLRGSFSEPLPASRWKMSRCIYALSTFCVVFYAVFGIFAKKLYTNTVRGNVLLNLENDPLMDVPLVAVFSTVVLSFPLLFHPLRGVLEELVFTTSLDDVAFATRLGGSTVLLLSQVLLAIVVPGIEVVFGLTGASTCFMICFAFPVVFFSRLYPWDEVRGGKLWVSALWVIVAFFMVAGITATWFLLSEG